jgi:hypothetical protein
MAYIIQKTLFSVLLGISFLAGSQDLKKINFSADLGSVSKDFPHYWKSTGFTPADLLDYPDMEMTLDYIKASGAIDFIRPHYLLDHVRIRNFGLHDQEIDWSELDAKLDKIVEADLKLIFEIMGNPVDREMDFVNEKNWDKAAMRGVLSYEIYVKAPGERFFKKVNPANILADGYAHVNAPSEGYQYKVRLVDYWDRKGKFSDFLAVQYWIIDIHPRLCTLHPVHMNIGSISDLTNLKA